LEHREPDRVPIFLGTSGATTMNMRAYERLRAYLGIPGTARTFWRSFQYALMDEEVLVRFHSDGRPLIPGAPPSKLACDISENRFVDAWGITWQRNAGNHYFDMVEHPLASSGLDDIQRYPWPDVSHAGRFSGLRQTARAIQEAGYAVVALSGITPFETGHMLRGMDNWMCDLVDNHEFVHAFMRKVTDLQLAAALRLIEEAGDHIDLISVADDLGSQKAPLISPGMYRQLIKPYHAEIFAAIKARTSAKVFFHTCGNVYSLIPDLIDAGVDVLNPVHVSAGDMGDTARLKREFGQQLCFCGAIDTQHVLPHGSPEDVRAEVRRRIADLAPGGGYFLSAVHCLQPDVPPANVVAMFDEALAAGKYPVGIAR